MKKLILILLAIILFCGVAEARQDKCIWIWDTDFDNKTEDPPDDVYCRIDGASYVSKGASYVQRGNGTSGRMTWDTVTPDGSSTIGSLHPDITDTQVICSNVTVVADLNVHNVGIKSDTLNYYFEIEDMADATIKTVNMDWPDSFKLTVTEPDDDAGCLVVYTTVNWD